MCKYIIEKFLHQIVLPFFVIFVVAGGVQGFPRVTVAEECLPGGEPPRSGIEINIARELRKRQYLDTGISWVRSHIGIPGNELADQAADFQSHLGEVAKLPNISTFEGLRAFGKAVRRTFRVQPSLGNGSRPQWGRRPPSEYTWMSTNRGPQREWLHRIGKSDSPLCPCGAVQSGDHITFTCQLHDIARQALLGAGQLTWTSLDEPRYHEEGTDQDNLVEEFFGYIFAHFN